jgi:hypothetical protein
MFKGQFRVHGSRQVFRRAEHVANELCLVMNSVHHQNIQRDYASDRSNKTFINRPYLETHMLRDSEGFARSRLSYFPAHRERVSRHFVFPEMKVIFDRVSEPC